jgi:ribosomal protein L31E
MADLIRTYIIPLRKAWLKTQRYKRAPKAARTVAAFIKRHMKTDDVRITPDLNHLLWEHGIKNPPGKIKVDAKKDDKGVCVVQVHGKPFPVPKEQAKKEGTSIMDKVRGMTGGKKEAEPKAEEKKAESAKLEPKKEEQKKEAPKPAAPVQKPAQPKPATPAPKPATPTPQPRPAQPAPKPQPAPAPKPEPKKEGPPLRLNR